MPVIHREHKKGHYKLGFWKIEETFDELFSMVCLSPADCSVLNAFGNEARKLEWLSVRVMLKDLVQNNTGIFYNQRRKPFLNDSSYNISISHSFKITSVLLSKNHKVGIDLEYMSHRIRNISDRFMNDKEYIAPGNDLGFYHLYLHWCAKEALYKICDKENLSFKANLIIDPFEPGDEGVIQGNVIRDGQHEVFPMKYFKFDGYCVVWCLK
jgi:4'-phosphopantetheinyl transferase